MQPLSAAIPSQPLPAGVELWHFDPAGVVHWSTRDALVHLDPVHEPTDREHFLRLIDDGQFTRYLVGNAFTSESNPSNATAKIGVMQPHSAFTPHAHATEHFVLSLGYSACNLYEASSSRLFHVRLVPGSLLHIPSLMPHSFNNRASVPLLFVVANTGMGVNHEEYAITAAQCQALSTRAKENGHSPPNPTESLASDKKDANSEARLTMPSEENHCPVDYAQLAIALRELECAMANGTLHSGVNWRERIAARLRQLAWRLERE